MRSALLFTALVASALAGPTGYRESCAQHCSQDNIFSYQPGRSYSYQYSVTTNTAILGDSGTGAQVYVTAHAKIDVTAPCDHTLRLTEVSLDGSSHAAEMAAALTRADLRFSFQDGRVEELCAAPSEDTWVLNFKRGLLTAFQTSITRPGTEEVQETDVLGVCLTHYQNKLEGDVLTLNKVKDLTSCTKRADLSSYLASTSYNTNSPVQSLPVLDSISTCTQTVEGGILVEASCEETHTFRPFSGGRGGASTTANTRLKLVSRDGPALTITEQQFVRKTPVFEAATEASPHTQAEAVTALLTQLDEVSHQDVRPEAPALFSRLVIALRGLDYPVLSRVYADTTETHSRKFLVDAMPLVGTAAAAAVVRDMYANGDLTQEETDAWYTSLTFLKNPTSEMFTAIAPMLETNPSQSAMLGTSSLVNTFCKINSGCGDDSGVQQVMRRIEAQLGSACRAVNEDQKIKILVALRALGNAGRWVNANHVLEQCYIESHNDMEVRVAAIEAWRHTPCEYDRSNLLVAYQDDTQDSELRIAAYLSLMTCPTPAVVAAVKDRLTSEGVNQVGSFVWTHLTNLQESAAPGKEWARVLLGEELLANKFSTEALRFSRNYESSFFTKELNLGAAVESNVIFGSKSFLPRSGMLNLTLDLFGESVNLFEVGGRIEGFETYLERLFGPDGYFPEDTVAAALKGMRQQKRETDTTTLEQFLEEATDEPRGSYYLRLFGNDVHYRHFRDLSGNGPALSSPLALLMELARGGNVDYTKSYQLLDTHYSVATVSGLPLTLGVKSTATVAFRMDGSFRAESLSDVLIQGHLRPSAAVQVDGVMMVDAHVTRAGVKVSSTAHTSTSLEGKVRINGGELVEMSFNTPRERMEILDLDTKYFYVHDDQEEEREREGPLSTNCFPTYMGIAVCGEESFPSSSSSFPTTLRTYFMKTDTQTGYTFRFTKSPNEVSVVFDNPGARDSRRVALNLQAQDSRLAVTMDSFMGNMEAKGEYTWQHDKKAVKSEVRFGASQFFLDAGLLTSNGNVIKVEPYLVWSAGDHEKISVNGKAVANLQENKYSIDAFLSAFFMPSLVTFKASYEGVATLKTLDMAIAYPGMDMSFGGKVFCEDSSKKIDVSVKYGDTFSANSDLLLQKQQEGDATTYSSKLTVNHSFDPDALLLEYEFTFSPSTMNNRMHFKQGPVDMVAEETWSHTYENGVRKIKGEVTSKCPHLEIDTLANTEITITTNTFLMKSVVNRKAGHDQGLHTLLIDLQRDPETSLTGRIDVDSTSKFNANADFRKVNPGHYTGQVSATASTGHMGELRLLDASVFFRDNSGPRTFSINSQASINVFGTAMSLSSEVLGTPQQGKVDLQTNFNGNDYGMKMEATPNSLLIDANLVKHVVVNAKVNPQGPEKTVLVNVEWDKEVNPDNTFKIEGKIQPEGISAEFRFLDKQFSVTGRKQMEGLDLEALWSPSQRVAAALRYSLGAAPSLTANLDTTFPGWEKQSVDVTTALQGNEVTCRASATWKNSQQATFVVKGRLQSRGSVHSEVIFTSTIADLERLSLTFNHEMADATINSNLHGAWNDRELNGSLELTPSSMGVYGLAIFTSPFTQPFKAILNHQLRDASLDSTFVATYGSTEVVQFTSSGRLSLSQGQHDVNLTLRLTTALEEVPDSEAILQYTMDGTALHLLLDGKVGQRKMMLNANGEKKVAGDSTSVSGDLRFLTPFTQPLTASLSHTHDGRSFTSQFEVTRIWSTYSFGSLKMHAEGHVLSEKDINLSAYISSPETKGSFSFTHKIENNNLTTMAKVFANKELISVALTGTLDSTARLLNLEGDVTSSFEGLEMKVKIDSKKEGNTQNTQVDLSRDTHHATLTHSFTTTDALNWESVFTLNDHYSLTNKMTHVAEEYQHQMEARWGEERLALDSRLTPVLTARSRKLDAHLDLVTPWEYLQKTKLVFHFEQEIGGETKASTEVEYKPGNKIVLSTTNKYNHEGEFFSTASLSTPFWQPLGYSLNLTLRPEKKAVLVLTHGQAETTVSLAGDYQQDAANAQLTLITPSLQHPLTLEVSYDVSSPSRIVGVAATYQNKYEAKVTFSGRVTNTLLELGLWEYIKDTSSQNTPWSAVHHFEGRWQHQLETMPFNMNAALQVESVTYQATATLDDTSFTTNVVLDGREGSLSARWLLQPTSSNLSVNFQSPVDVVKDFNMAVAYDVAAMEGQAKMKYDSHELDLLAKMEGKTFIFEGKTPFDGWEVLGASFFASGTTINASVSRNERKIEVTGTQHLRPAKGKVELVVTTPYHGYETISFDVSYNFLSENKTVKFKTIYGTSEIFAKGIIKLANPLTPKVILNITTPFSDLRTLRASTDWTLSGTTKTAAAKVVYNEQEFSWNVEVSLEGTTQRLASRVTTPFPGWTQASLQASISVSESPYEVRVTVQKEGVSQDFSGKLMLNGNTIQGQVKTPIPGLELVELDGTYTSGEESFSAVIHATRGSDKYEVNTEISFAKKNPKLKVEVATPFVQTANLKLEVEANFTGPQQDTLSATFSKNDQTLSAVTFTLKKKIGFVTLSLKTPLPGFSSLEVEGSYDLRGDVKKTELNVTKEGERQHFALAITLNDNHVVLDVVTPFSGFQVMKMDADYTSSAPGQHLLVANFVKDRETYNFRGGMELSAQGVEVTLTTPITPVRHVVVDARYDLLSDGAGRASIRFERNNDVFELRSQCSLSPSMSSFSVAAATPVPGWNNMGVDLKYTIEANKLSAEAFLQREDFRKEVKVEATYGAERGSLTVRMPVEGWETLAAEYLVTVISNKQATALVKVTHNNREFTFSANGHYTQDSIALTFQTPFESYKEFSLEASINLATRSAKTNLQAGSYSFSANASYTLGDMFLEVATPFPTLRFGSVAVKHVATPGGIEASLTVIHNKNNYFLLGEATVAPRSSLVVLQTKTPIAALPSATLKLQYNLDNKAELLTAQLTAGNRSYGLLLAGDLQDKLASLKMEMTTPFSGWTQIKFESKVDLTQDDKMIELVVEREGNVKAINIHGKLIGSGLDFDLRTPFAGLNRLNVSGNINRAKRSIEFQMMNDAGEASILTSFNSVKFELKTPFARMEDMSFEVSKDDRAYRAHWKRNQNYLMLEMTKDPEQQTASLEIKSELQGWELLALAGRLDQQTEQAYASGQINERKVELTVSGMRDDKRRTRRCTLDLKTPYANYQHVTGELKFSPRRRTIKMESNSSEFKVDMTSTRRSGLQLEVFVPNSIQETQLRANLKADGGSIDFTSRFPLFRSINYKYSLSMTTEIQMAHKLLYNKMEIFSLEFHANPETKMVHFDIHGRLHGRHTNLHIHREGFQTFNIILKREVTQSGRTTEKQLSIEMTGSGNLPEQGTIHTTLTNSFAEVPRTTTIHAEIDRTSSPKHVNMQVTFPGSKLYTIDMNYNIDLSNPHTGDFQVSITTPDRSAAPWKNFSGKWDVSNPQQTTVEFELGNTMYKGQGSVSLLETNLEFVAQGIKDPVFLKWRFLQNSNNRDYFLKVGPASAYTMVKLKGTVNGIESGNIEGGFKFSFQPEELLFTSTWNRQASAPPGSGGTFTGEGEFTYGQYTGTHKLNINRDAINKVGNFEFSVTSNHPRYQNVLFRGKYDVQNKLVFNATLAVGERVNKIDIDLSNFSPKRSRNTIEYVLRFLPPAYQSFRMSLSHNFRNNNNKQIKVEAKIGSKESHLKANWGRSDNFDVLKGSLEIKSIFIGEVNVGMDYDVSDINNAKAEIHYTRNVDGQPEKKVDAKWTRTRTPDHLQAEMTIDSTFEMLHRVRAYATADFSNPEAFTLDTGVEADEKRMTLKMNVNRQTVDVQIATPFDGFESIKGNFTFNLQGKKKTVTLHYERGSRQAHMELTLNKRSRTKGDLTLDLTSPFDMLRVLKVTARWNENRATVEYVRNNVRISMTGKAQVTANRSEFNLSFTAPSGKAVTIAASYNVAAFITGRGTSPAKLAGLSVDMGDPKFMFELKGFRNDDQLYVELDGNTSFLMVRNLHLKLDSELNTQKREGTFEFRLNDFVFEIYNEFQKYDDGYYIKSRVESSLLQNWCHFSINCATPQQPTNTTALVFGLGRRGAERIFTLGYGEEKEVTFSIVAKNNFRSGFTGKVDIPNFGYDGVVYDVSYGFPSNDQLEVKLEAQLGSEEHLEAEFEYNSDGLKARLSTPFTGDHSARVRRSISADSFYSEVGFDDYNLRLRGGFNDGDIKRGVVLEADILGRQFLFNYQLQSEGMRYTEGKLILQTPFRAWKKMGGVFTFSNVSGRVQARAEAFVPFFLNIPRIMAAVDLDLINKIEGEATLDVAGEQFKLRSNLVGGSLQQGYQGSVRVQTPFHALPSLEVTGTIKMPSLRNLEADLKITNMYTTYEVDLTYEVTSTQVKVDATILPGHLIGSKISLLLESLAPTQKKMELRVDDDYLVGQFTMASSTFTMNVDTRVAGVQRQLSVDTQYSTLDDLRGEVIAILGEQRHKLQGALSVAATSVRGEVLLDSVFIGGVRKLEFNASVPNMSFEQVSFSVSLTASQVYSFSMELDTRDGVVATAEINTPALPSTIVNLQITLPRAALTVTTPSATHTAAVSWRQTRKMPADQIVSAELDTPLLGQKYALRMVMSGGAKAVVKAELEVGNVTHHLEANAFMGSSAGGFSLDIQTPYMNIQKAALRGSLDLSDSVELQAVASMADVTNTFIFLYNANKGTLLAEAVSPYIPTGMMKATAEISNTMPNVNLQVALMNAHDVISGRLDMKIPSTQDVTIRATISTPLEALKTVNAVIKYQQTDVTHVVISLDHPITFRAAAKFANTDDKITGNVTIKTSIATLEYVEADLVIPLTEFAPRATLTLPNNKYGLGATYATKGYLKAASATFYLDDQTYGGDFSLRNRAPYELAFKYRIPDSNTAFHLRTDSSFFTFLM